MDVTDRCCPYVCLVKDSILQICCRCMHETWPWNSDVTLHWIISPMPGTLALWNVAIRMQGLWADFLSCKWEQVLNQKNSRCLVRMHCRLEGFKDPWDTAHFKGRQLQPSTALDSLNLADSDSIVTVRRVLVPEGQCSFPSETNAMDDMLLAICDLQHVWKCQAKRLYMGPSAFEATSQGVLIHRIESDALVTVTHSQSLTNLLN